MLRETYGSNTLDFFYDTNGHPYALDYNGTKYYYITNLQGDVMSMVDGDGAVVATYNYDPYGNVLTASGTVADINPLRYRGYYYDSESGLYYLQSRYYDPELGRFINADSFASTGQGILGNNMFAYCNNSPVVHADAYGDCGYIAGTTIWRSCGRTDCAYYTAFTLAAGGSFCITFGPYVFGVQIAIATDSQGCSEVQVTFFSPMSTDALVHTPSTEEMLEQVSKYEEFRDVVDTSLMVNLSYFNTPSVENLHAEGYQLGGTLGEGTAIAIDYNIIPNVLEKPYTGITFSVGKGSTDVHAVMGYTMRLCFSRVTVYDILYALHQTQFGG